jgi:UDP-N-acetylglucosamine acyltransferase
MAGSHVGHDCQVSDHCSLADNGMLGGHCALAEGAHVGGNSAVHQFCRLGRLSVLEDTSSATVDIAPFIVQRGRNVVVGINVAGMRRAGLSEGEIRAMQRCYDTVYLRGLLLTTALDQLEEELGAVDVVREFVAFARLSRRGIGRVRDQGSDATS